MYEHLCSEYQTFGISTHNPWDDETDCWVEWLLGNELAGSCMLIQCPVNHGAAHSYLCRLCLNA